MLSETPMHTLADTQRAERFAAAYAATHAQSIRGLYKNGAGMSWRGIAKIYGEAAVTEILGPEVPPIPVT